MQRRQFRDHRLDGRARVDQRQQRQVARPRVRIDLLGEKLVGGLRHDRAAVTAGVRAHEALRFEDAQRLAHGAASEARVVREIALRRQHFAGHVSPAKDGAPQPVGEHRRRLRRKWCAAYAHATVNESAPGYAYGTTKPRPGLLAEGGLKT